MFSLQALVSLGPASYNRNMEKEPPQPPSDEPPDAEIIEFPASEMQRARERHPAHGRETPEQTLVRLAIEKDQDDPDGA